MLLHEKESEVSNPLPPKPAHRMSRYPADNGVPLAHIPDHPTFHNHSIINSVGDWNFFTPNTLTGVWCDTEGFLTKHYGLMDVSDTCSGEKPLWNKKVSLKPARPYEDIVQFYTSVITNRSWPSTCDLSLEIAPSPGIFPS